MPDGVVDGRVALAVEIGAGALQGEQPRLAVQPLAQKVLDRGDLLVDQLELPVDARERSLVAGNVRLGLRDLAVAHGDLIGECLGAGDEIGALGVHQGPHLRVRGRLRDQIVGERGRCRAGLLGGQSAAAGEHGDQLRPGAIVVRASPGVVQDHDHVAGLDLAALLDADLRDDPALEVLHRLAEALRRHDGGRDRGARQRHQHGPGAEAAEEHEQNCRRRQHGAAKARGALDGCGGLGRRRHLHAPQATRAGRISSPRIASRGPNRATSPFSITMTRSA